MENIRNKLTKNTPNLKGCKHGDKILFCNSCGFQLPPNSECKPICPDCGKQLHIWEVENIYYMWKYRSTFS